MTWYVVCGYGGFPDRVDTRMGEQATMTATRKTEVEPRRCMRRRIAERRLGD